MLKNYYKNKKIIITGHNGFKGSWLSSFLTLLGSKIYGISLKPEKNSHFSKLKLNNKISNFNFDIRNKNKILKTIVAIQPDIVFHLAAQALVKHAYKNPIDTWTTNVIGTLNLIESLKKLKKKCIIVIITSDKCYLNKEKKAGYKENDELGGYDPYSASKAATEHVFFSEYHSFLKKNTKLRIVSARGGNVIGGGDWSNDRIIPDFMKSIAKRKVLKIRNPYSIRPWVHVLEPLMGYLKLAYSLSKNVKLNGQSFNFGPNNKSNKRVIDVVTELNKVMKIGKWKSAKLDKKFMETKYLSLNSNLAKAKLNWRTKFTFKKRIQLTAEWYFAYFFKKKIITNDQIKKFLDEYNFNK